MRNLLILGVFLITLVSGSAFPAKAGFDANGSSNQQ